jgi:type IV secretion system protein VirB5
MNTRSVVGWISSLLLLAMAPSAQAQWAVVDVGAITQLVQQVRTMQEQLTTARDQLTQARDAYRSMTGGRGMERLLAGMPRNYLPGQWSEIAEILDQTSTAYGSIAGETKAWHPRRRLRSR